MNAQYITHKIQQHIPHRIFCNNNFLSWLSSLLSWSVHINQQPAQIMLNQTLPKSEKEREEKRRWSSQVLSSKFWLLSFCLQLQQFLKILISSTLSNRFHSLLPNLLVIFESIDFCVKVSFWASGSYIRKCINWRWFHAVARFILWHKTELLLSNDREASGGFWDSWALAQLQWWVVPFQLWSQQPIWPISGFD